MFRFYQTGEKTPWVPLRDGPDVEARARAEGAIKLTVLAVSKLPDPDTGALEDARYSGPMYFDIDFPADQRAKAIQSTQVLVQRLREYGLGPGTFSLFCSGNKGFHVLVPERAFRRGRPLADLPHIYREIALALYVEGLDMGVYRTGRGCCWRLPNTRRESGAYCVPLTLEELSGLSEDGYDQLVSAPRDIPPPQPPTAPLSQLEILFEQSRGRAKRTPPPRHALAQEKLAPFAENFPGCITQLEAGERLEGATFNAVALQVATFIARAGVQDAAAETLLSEVSERQGSERYPSPHLRLQHLRGLTRYVAATDRYQFACEAMRTVLPEPPCGKCPLNGEGGRRVPEAGNDSGVFEHKNGYWWLGSPPKMLTNFILIPIDEFRAQPIPGQTPEVLARTMEVVINGSSIGDRFFDSDVWLSRTNFLKAIKSIPQSVYYGGDTQVQGIKHYIDQCDYEPGEVMEVMASGIHRTHYEDAPLWVYVEPGFSVNSNRVCGTHYLHKDAMAAPRLAEVPLPDPDSPHPEERAAIAPTIAALRALLEINNHETLGALLGWFVAAHFRPHCMEAFREFPLLNLWGASGTGKSATSELLMWLSGCQEASIGEAVDAPGTTRYAITAYLASATSIVRRVEEYNKSKVSKDLYRQIGDLLKASFNGNAATRGTIGRSGQTTSDFNARVVSLPINAPIVYLSEQTTTVPALAARSVQVQMTPGGLSQGRSAYAEAFAQRKALPSLAKLLVYAALDTPVEAIKALVEAQADFVPESIGDRPRIGYQIVLAGLDFLHRALDRQGMPQLEDELNTVRQSLRGYIQQQAGGIAREKLRSEVDDVLEDMALMAHLSEQAHGGAEWLTEGRHYHTDAKYLYLDIRAAHALYKRFKRHAADGVVIESTDQFMKLLVHEPYFVSNAFKCAHLSTRRPLACLSLEKLRLKGVDVSLFPGVTV